MGAQSDLIKVGHRVGIDFDQAAADQLVGGVGDAVITLDNEGDEAADSIRASVQLKDTDGNNFAGAVDFLLTSDAAGLVLGTAPTGTVTAGTGTIQHSPVAKTFTHVVSDSTGLLEMDVVDSGTPTLWPVAVMPDGRRVVGPAMTWA